MGILNSEDKYHEFHIDDLANQKTGLISFIANSEMEASDPEVFVLASETSDSTKLGFSVKINSYGSGAGLNYKTALYSTIGEGLERYALGLIHEEDLIFGSANDLSKKYNVIKYSEWNFFHKSQKKLPFDFFDNNTTIAWVKSDSISFEEEFLVPACIAYIPYYKHFNSEKIIATAVSTGAACGNSINETIFKGICELIERDAFLIMWRNKLTLPKIIIDNKSTIYETFKNKFERPGLEYILVNTTLDLKIPSVFGILIISYGSSKSIIVGGAADPNPEKAVLKTLTELIQGLKWRDHIGDEEFLIEDNFMNIRSFQDRMKMYSLNNLEKQFDFIFKNENYTKLSSIKTFQKDERQSYLKEIVQFLKSKKFNVLAKDYTTIEAAECGLVVTKVFIPGLETMEGDFQCQFLGNDRWQKVPLELGIRQRKSKLSEINPYPHPYP